MRKNNMLRIASVLLVAVLLSTCAISGVFAQYYTTIADDDDAARVAKWGVKIVSGDSENLGLFDKEYAKTDAAYTVDDNTVVSSTSWNLVAPGTSDTWNAFDVSGTPEVAVLVTYEATVELLNWDVGGTDYCPIIFTVGDVTYGMTGMKDSNGNTATNTYDTAADLAAAIATDIKDASIRYAAKTDLSTVDFPTISWVWAFTGNDKVKDTALGDKAATAVNEEDAPRISIVVGATVEQVD